MNELPWSVRWSVQVYGRLVRVYPGPFRREYGEAMLEVFSEMAESAWRGRGLRGLAFMWFYVLGDLVWSAISEHWRAENRRPEMKAAFFATASVVLAAVVQMFVMGGIGIVFLTVHLVSSGTMAGGPPHWLGELAMFFLSPLLAAMILMHTKPFYRPWLTAPLGAMGLFTFAFLSDSKAPWWAAVVVVVLGGALSLAGCYLGSRIARRRSEEEIAAVSGVVE